MGIEPTFIGVVLGEILNLLSKIASFPWFFVMFQIFQNFNLCFSENIGYCGPFGTSFIWGPLGALEFFGIKKTRNLLHKYQDSVQIMCMKFFKFDILATETEKKSDYLHAW